MIEVVKLRSTDLEMLGPVFYADDYALTRDSVVTEIVSRSDIWDLTESEFPSKPWRRKRFPLHSCFHRHVDGSVTLVNLSDSNISEIVSNSDTTSEVRVLVRLTGKALAVPVDASLDVAWNGARCRLIQKIVRQGPITYATTLVWVNSTGSIGSNGRATYRSYSYDRVADQLFEGPSGLISRSVSLADFELFAADTEPSTFPGTLYGGVRSTWSCHVVDSESDEGKIELFLKQLTLGLPGHYPMSRDTDRRLFDRLLDRIRPDKVNLAEYVIGFRDLPDSIRNIPEVACNLRNRFIRRRFPELSGDIRLPDPFIGSNRDLNRARYELMLARMNPRLDTAISAEINRSLDDLDVTTRDLGGLYLGYIYGIRPLPADTRVVTDLPQMISQARSQFQLDLRTRQVYSCNGWLGYQAVQVVLAQSILEENPSIDQVLDLDAPLRAGTGLAFQNGRTLLDDAVIRLDQAGLPSNQYEVALNLWELFPYSFVADWFVGIGDKLDSLSQEAIWGALPVDFCCRTVKAVKSISDSVQEIATRTGLTALCDVQATSYDRFYAHKLATPAFEGGSPVYGQHWVEGSLLAFTRTRKR